MPLIWLSITRKQRILEFRDFLSEFETTNEISTIFGWKTVYNLFGFD